MKRDFRGLKRHGHSALRQHVLAVGRRGRERHGPIDGLEALARLLADRECVRHPVDLVFDASRLDGGRFAEAVAERTDEGLRFELYVHPRFEGRADALPALVAYHLVEVNYGPMASEEDAVALGAELFGLTQSEYYAKICALADELAD